MHERRWPKIHVIMFWTTSSYSFILVAPFVVAFLGWISFDWDLALSSWSFHEYIDIWSHFKLFLLPSLLELWASVWIKKSNAHDSIEYIDNNLERGIACLPLWQLKPHFYESDLKEFHIMKKDWTIPLYHVQLNCW